MNHGGEDEKDGILIKIVKPTPRRSYGYLIITQNSVYYTYTGAGHKIRFNKQASISHIPNIVFIKCPIFSKCFL